MNFKPKIEEKRWKISNELELIELWSKEKRYKFQLDPSRPTLIIDTPPPYASGPWHVGGAAHYVQIDMIGRYFRMKGYNVLLPFYADRNGLPVEVTIEKKCKIIAHEIAKKPEGREEFLKLCKEELDAVERELVKIWTRLGCSFEYWRSGTDSPEYRKITQATFIELWKKGLIYEAERPVMWCPRCRTALAEAELEYIEEQGSLYYIKFKVKEMNKDLIIATTRPELLAACGAVAYHPNDQRYKGLKGRIAIVPLYNIEVPIIGHEAVKPEFGTGIMMICSYGDQVDVRLFRELRLVPKVIISEEGKMTKDSGPIAGLTVKEARKKIIELLREKGYVVKEERIIHTTPVCWRCKTPIEFIHTKEFFLKQLEFKEKMKEIADKMNFYPPEHKRRLIDWINSITMDWPISRSRFYATEVPIWRCRKCNSILVPEPGKYYKPWKDPAPWNKCPKCGAPQSMLVGETKVFDTWFDSSISVLYVSGFMRNEDLFKMYLEGKTIALRPQGIDIVRTWLYYTILRVYQLFNKPAFTWVRLTGMGLDEKGEAMHKSKGNVIDPQPVVEKYGADAFRYWSAAASKLGSDYRYQEQLIRTGALFVTKLWNIARFISAFPYVENNYKLRPLDLAILHELNKTIGKVINAYDNLDVYVPAHEIYRFTWDVFAAHYIELVKARAYGRSNFSEEEQRGAWWTLHTILQTILKLLAPIMPFITDYIWRKLYDPEGVHTKLMPMPVDDWSTHPYRDSFSKIMDLNSRIWTFKKNRGMKLSDPLVGVLYIPKDLEPFAKDIKELHKISDIRIGITPKKGQDLGQGIYYEEI